MPNNAGGASTKSKINRPSLPASPPQAWERSEAEPRSPGLSPASGREEQSKSQINSQINSQIKGPSLPASLPQAGERSKAEPLSPGLSPASGGEEQSDSQINSQIKGPSLPLAGERGKALGRDQ